ncbi:MAG: HU family DNA-binding protein [Gemmatimonadetes bacterium]|nr:HU family DNA-binding protein [Gemmatimonadota bacterium]
MNKSDLAAAVAAKASISRKEAMDAVNAIFSSDDGAIVEALRNGDRVQVIGFGTFERRSRAARTGRNPATGATIEIAASQYPAFRAGKGLKDAF